jgi:hypothetical protein
MNTSRTQGPLEYEALRHERDILQKISARRAEMLEIVGLHADCTEGEARQYVEDLRRPVMKRWGVDGVPKHENRKWTWVNEVVNESFSRLIPVILSEEDIKRGARGGADWCARFTHWLYADEPRIH